MGIKYLECVGYEADDIIGTISKMVDNNDEVNIVAQLFLKLMIWPQISH